jgi:hypothetical protein
MNTGHSMGICSSWHSEEPATEAELFEKFQLQGEGTIVTGALCVDGKICIPSRAAKTESELELFCLDQNGAPQILKARKDCQEVLASSLSLAW